VDASQEAIREYRIFGDHPGAGIGRKGSRPGDSFAAVPMIISTVWPARRSLSRLNPAHLIQSMIKSNPEMHWSMRKVVI